MEKDKKCGMYGANDCGSLGTLSQGIPSHDKEPTAEPLVALSNKFSSLHDMSMKETMRKVGGKGTSSQDE